MRAIVVTALCLLPTAYCVACPQQAQQTSISGGASSSASFAFSASGQTRRPLAEFRAAMATKRLVRQAERAGRANQAATNGRKNFFFSTSGATNQSVGVGAVPAAAAQGAGNSAASASASSGGVTNSAQFGSAVGGVQPAPGVQLPPTPALEIAPAPAPAPSASSGQASAAASSRSN